MFCVANSLSRLHVQCSGDASLVTGTFSVANVGQSSVATPRVQAVTVVGAPLVGTASHICCHKLQLKSHSGHCGGRIPGKLVKRLGHTSLKPVTDMLDRKKASATATMHMLTLKCECTNTRCSSQTLEHALWLLPSACLRSGAQQQVRDVDRSGV